jgi:O-antigen ligase
MQKELSETKSLIILITLSLLYFLWFPGKFNPWLPENLNVLLLIVSPLIAASCLGQHIKRNASLEYLVILYGCWILLSFIIHYTSLNMLNPLSMITVSKFDVTWGLSTLKNITIIYILFPLLLLLSIQLFKITFDIYKMLYLLPILYIPSLIVGMYQGFFDIHFLNVPFFVKLGQASGLGVDPNSFGLSLYLLFPLCILGFVLVPKWWQKLSFTVLILAMFSCLLLSGSRTGLLGTIMFMIALPLTWAWVNNKKLAKTKCKTLIISSILIVAIIVMAGYTFLKFNSAFSFPMVNRVQATYSDYKDGGIRRVLETSWRSHLWLQAYRLVREAPLAGWGPGGYFRQLDNTRFKYGEDPKYKFIDLADSHYLQIASELGVLGLSINLLLGTCPLILIFRINKHIRIREERWAVGVISSALVIMMVLFVTAPYTIFIDVLWIYTLFLGFLYVTGLKYGCSFPQIDNRPFIICIICASMLFILGVYSTSFGSKGYQAIQNEDWWPLKYERNCFQTEAWKEGKVRWCSKNASLRIPLSVQDAPNMIRLSVTVFNPDIQTNPVTVRYGGREGVTHELILTDHSWKTIEIPSTTNDIVRCTTLDRSETRCFVASLDVSRTWVPKQMGVGEDTRELGVAVLVPDP